MDTDYVVYKRYEKRVGVGKLPEIIKMYLSESLPHIELTNNIDDALTFSESEAKELAYLTCMNYGKLKVDVD